METLMLVSMCIIIVILISVLCFNSVFMSELHMPIHVYIVNHIRTPRQIQKQTIQINNIYKVHVVKLQRRTSAYEASYQYDDA